MRYTFVAHHYDRSLDALLADMGDRSRKTLSDVIASVQAAGLTSLFDLIDRVSRQSSAEALMVEADLTREQIEAMVDYIKRVILPNVAQVRQCIRDDEPDVMSHFEVLKAHKLANGFALLEAGYTPSRRASLSHDTSVPKAAILDLVHRVDITRMPWMGGRMVKMLWWVGMRSLQDLRDIDPHILFEGLNDYYAQQGTSRPYDATTSTIEGMVASAQRIPTVVVV
jgi:hypothetical protein